MAKPEISMLERSRFLGRLIGLYILLVSIAMLSHRQTTLEAVAGVLRNPSMMLTLGLVTVAAGLEAGEIAGARILAGSSGI
jgi:hypothetical protein